MFAGIEGLGTLSAELGAPAVVPTCLRGRDRMRVTYDDVRWSQNVDGAGTI